MEGRNDQTGASGELDEYQDVHKHVDMPGDYNMPIHNDAFRQAYEGDMRSVVAHLDREPKLLNAIGHLDLPGVVYVPSTLLHFACRAGHDQLAFALIKRGADITVKNQIGDTPLTYCDDTFRRRLMDLADQISKK
jgi:ankyrin repeat protein